jgi:predicted metal-dependent HD superfamily phosphohydrolase
MPDLPERDAKAWHRLWRDLELDPPPGLVDQILAAYDDPKRHYHSRQHLRDSLRRFWAVRRLAREPLLVELALWFHDAVYRADRSDNEEQSAKWATEALLEAGADSEAADTVAHLILATRHGSAMPEGDAALLCDIDLAILGARPGTYDEYQQAIRAEYAWVPAELYRKGRAELLRNLLRREQIYLTEPFSHRLERRARANLTRELGELGGEEEASP